jgi:hypothetical protein
MDVRLDEARSDDAALAINEPARRAIREFAELSDAAVATADVGRVPLGQPASP